MKNIYIKDIPVTEKLIEEKLKIGLKELVKIYSNIYPLESEDIYDEYEHNDIIDKTKSIEWNDKEKAIRNEEIYQLREKFDKDKEIAIKNIENRLVKYIQEKAECSLETAQKAWHYLKGLNYFTTFIDYYGRKVTVNENLGKIIEDMIDFIKME